MRYVLRCLSALLVVSLLAAVVGGSPASATYEPGEPDLAWNQQLADGFGEFFDGVAAYGDSVWSVGYLDPTNDGTRTAVVMRSDTEGRTLSSLQEGSGVDGGQDYALAVDAGVWGAVVTGRTDGSFPGTGVTPESGETDTWVQRLAPDGTVLWTMQYPTDSRYFTKAVTVLGDAVYVVGDQSGSFSVDKLSLDTGELLASQTYEDGGNGVLHAVTVLDGQLIVGGYVQGTFVPGEQQGDYDNVVMSIDPSDLSVTWADQFGTPGMDLLMGITSRDHTIYWAGTLGNQDDSDTFTPLVGGVGAISADGTQLWQQQLGPGYAVVSDVTATSQGIVLSGHVSAGALGAETASYGGDDAFLQGRSFAGDTLWTEVYGGTSYDTFASVTSVGDDQLFTAGASYAGMFGEHHAHGAGVVAEFDVPHLLKPDVSVQTRRGTGYQDDNTYGAARPVRVVLHRGHSMTSRLRLEDDGFLPDRLTLQSCRGLGSHLHLRLTRGHHDISASARSGSYETPKLTAGHGQTLELDLSAGRRASGAHSCTLATHSTSARAASDLVRLKIVIKP